MAKKTKKTTRKKAATPKQVKALTHDEASRKNIPTAEFQSVMRTDEQAPVRVAYQRGPASGGDGNGRADPLAAEKAGRNRDLDPQLVWRGKDEQDWSDLVVNAPPLFIQEKVHPKALVDDLMRRTRKAEAEARQEEEPALFADLYADFNGLPSEDAKTEFYQHEANWTNRMILGDSLQVMASLAEREGLRGQVQCIYLDPPYGIKFNSNFQWSTTTRTVSDGKVDHITREAEQVKAFRDTWRDGIHSYLTYLRDRLLVARDLLAPSGSIFVQIGDENIHRVRSLLDDLFGSDNCLASITLKKAAGAGSPTGSTDSLAQIADYVLWYAKDRPSTKYRQPYTKKELKEGSFASVYRLVALEDGSTRGVKPEEVFDPGQLPLSARVFRIDTITNASPGGRFTFDHQGDTFKSPKGYWLTTETGMGRIGRAGRINISSKGGVGYVRYFDDFIVFPQNNVWTDVSQGGFTAEKVYVVQTNTKIVERCLLMASDPGDLVLDPTCGSGTTAYVAEQWGRRWITIDTSRVALALARARIMGARYPYYLLADSADGVRKEAEVTRTDLPEDFGTRKHGEDIRQGFVYERVPHITLKSIANNTEIDAIWERMQPAVEAALANLNSALKGHATPFKVTTGGRQGKAVDFTAKDGKMVKMPSGEEAPANGLLEWEVPREATGSQGGDWPKAAKDALAAFWEARISRQREIDASIAAKAEYEYLYDKPYEDRKKVRVAGPFTVESISPHRTLAVDEDDELIDPAHPAERGGRAEDEQGFAEMILANLKTAGVQQAHKEDKIEFSSLAPWPGRYICAEGRFSRESGEDGSGPEQRAGIFIGPEFGTVSRQDLVGAAREAGDAGFDVLISCAFNYEAHASEFSKLGKINVLKARMNADLHMGEELKNTGKGNLFVIFGEPDIEILPADGDEDGGPGQVRVKINGVDVFHPSTGEVRSDGAEGIACWFIDTDYNEESFFVRHAYFLGASDPYKSLRTTLKAEINEEAWATLNSDVSRAFPKPEGGRIAVKVINHLGDEVMKVFRVE